MMKKAVLAMVLSILAGVAACTCQPELGEARISYPYVATPERAAQILGNYRKVKVGMSVEQVQAVLGEADEIKPALEPRKKNARQIGVTHWYLIQRRRAPVGLGPQTERLVRIYYDLQGRVAVVDHWGFRDIVKDHEVVKREVIGVGASSERKCFSLLVAAMQEGNITKIEELTTDRGLESLWEGVGDEDITTVFKRWGRGWSKSEIRWQPAAKDRAMAWLGPESKEQRLEFVRVERG